MTEHQISELLLELTALFLSTYLLAGLLDRIHIPGILSALFVAILAQYSPIGSHLLSDTFQIPLVFLSNIGVLFLLFYIGLHIDLNSMRHCGKDIFYLTVLNTLIPFLRRYSTRKVSNLLLVSIIVLFALGDIADSIELGAVIGAITAGVLMRPVFDKMGQTGAQTSQNSGGLSP